MELKMHYVREQIEKGTITLHYVTTTNQLADILTKNLVRPTFEKIRKAILVPDLAREATATATLAETILMNTGWPMYTEGSNVGTHAHEHINRGGVLTTKFYDTEQLM